MPGSQRGADSLNALAAVLATPSPVRTLIVSVQRSCLSRRSNAIAERPRCSVIVAWRLAAIDSELEASSTVLVRREARAARAIRAVSVTRTLQPSVAAGQLTQRPVSTRTWPWLSDTRAEPAPAMLAAGASTCTVWESEAELSFESVSASVTV